ncbi:MAG: nitroreductase [Chloroflexi bacterium]|nr:nitroreductase [Chloroflexota bacterium]
MDVFEAVNTRRSIRTFKPDAVPQAVLKEILEAAQRAPSGTNTQPWEFAVATGSKLEEIRQAFIAKADEKQTPDIASSRSYPEPYLSRIRTIARNELEKKGIQMEDRRGRGWWRLRNITGYGAPCIIYICVDRPFYLPAEGTNIGAIFDCGLVVENIALLATGRGLGTVLQSATVAYPDVLRRVFGLPDSKLMVLGIAIGYPDWTDPINQIRTERETLDKVTTWHGFE